MIRRSVVSAICPSRPYVVSTKTSFDQLSFDEVSYTQLNYVCSHKRERGLIFYTQLNE